MKLIQYSFLLLLLITTIGCSKFLERKPDAALAIPTLIHELQALLDDNSRFNQNQNGLSGEASADNYYMTPADWAAITVERDKSIYTWGDELFYDHFPNEWSNMYAIIFRSNLVLEKLNTLTITHTDTSAWSQVKGTALFFRGEALHVLARNFAKAFDPATAATDLGVPIRLDTDFTKQSKRATVKETFDEVLQDLKGAARHLPVAPQHVMRPSKPAAYALLSRVHLYLHHYESAALYADSALQLYSHLIDYNTLNLNNALPFVQFNSETIFYSHSNTGLLNQNRAKIDTTLYKSYHLNDLRRQAFFTTGVNGAIHFKGHYTGAASNLFTGLSTNEVYLNKAEALARIGRWQEGINVLNSLMIRRWKTGTFIPFAPASMNEAIQIIVQERRKELLMRDLRWMDIKRLNQLGAGIQLKRIINNQEYTLQPNADRFAMPLPAYIIELTGMPQNPR